MTACWREGIGISSNMEPVLRQFGGAHGGLLG
jgi:hypothetical protein